VSLAWLPKATVQVKITQVSKSEPLVCQLLHSAGHSFVINQHSNN